MTSRKLYKYLYMTLFASRFELCLERDYKILMGVKCTVQCQAPSQYIFLSNGISFHYKFMSPSGIFYQPQDPNPVLFHILLTLAFHGLFKLAASQKFCDKKRQLATGRLMGQYTNPLL